MGQTSLLGQDTVLLHVLSTFFKEMYCLHLQHQRFFSDCLTLPTNTLHFFATVRNTLPTQHQTPEEIKPFFIEWHCVNCLISLIFKEKNYITFVNDKFEQTCKKSYARLPWNTLRRRGKGCPILSETVASSMRVKFETSCIVEDAYSRKTILLK